MSYICSVGTSIPKHNISQEEVKELVQNVFSYTNREVKRLLPVFDHARIENRQFVVDKTWFEEEHTFAEKNNIYQENAIHYSLEAIDDCLQNEHFLTNSIPYEAVDLIIYVSSSGLSTPTIDAFLLNERPFREDVQRMPLWGLGCAGGAIGLSRAHDWVKAHPEKTALVICCEFCGVTFQKGDHRKSNLVGTALFGDGVSAALLVGKESPYLANKRQAVPKVIGISSRTKRDSTDVMGWNVTNHGLEVIFSKSIPSLVESFWKEHVEHFFQQFQMEKEAIYAYLAHPGGIKVLQAMEDVLQAEKEKLKHSYNVLRNHGNMSSVTVLYVLKEWMKEAIKPKEKVILSALGPGFSSEILLMEWSE
ncbi:type III polyketide synthase [Oceanobacillus alkalisoli]|uniref:type III polyketide synthase n=1 Tax=Oceanobacillus alkalisoli TaxID=2925113 RepID=UPI001F1224DD|nr:3-oxoacyl-[acyl-carrier-protein] synthase III C-terminal domain-containing protein [Oceanobacillus alkalisoli]MCF3944913.1 type III polyketide synthase [Oceanobacillus alkalisoli]